MKQMRIDKKCLLAFIALVFLNTLLFAGVELDVDYYGTPIMDTYTKETHEKFSHKSALGVDNCWNFYFASPVFMNIGLSLGYGVDYFRTMQIPALSPTFPNQKIAFDWGVDIFVNAGAVVRFNLNAMNSFIASSGVQFRLILAEKNGSEQIALISPQFDFLLHGGYRLWFLNKEKFSLGFSTGLHLIVPCGVVLSAELTRGSLVEECEKMTAGGFGAKLYLGLCMNFGKK